MNNEWYNVQIDYYMFALSFTAKQTLTFYLFDSWSNLFLSYQNFTIPLLKKGSGIYENWTHNLHIQSQTSYHWATMDHEQWNFQID